MKLLPHQTAFLETFFNPNSKRVILLRGDVALGKSIALVALCSRLLQEQPTARALFLAPAALRMFFVEMLRIWHTPALLVDRYKFREMLDSTTDSLIWPPGVVAALSADFAKQPDIKESLAETQWDLLIADEVHWFKGARAEVLRRVGASSTRVVLTTVMGIDTSDYFEEGDLTVVNWQSDQLMQQGESPLILVPRPILYQVPFDLSQAERNLFKTTRALCQNMEGGTPTESWFAKSLTRRLLSSPAALEGTLQRQRARHKTGGDMDVVQDEFEEELDEDNPGAIMNILSSEETTGMATRMLQEIEAINFDSKLDAFIMLLNRLNQVNKRICVITDYMDTLYYLAAEIEGRGHEYQLLHGGMSFEDRCSSLKVFADTGAILVATKAINNEGLNLSEVTHLCLYDIPISEVAQQQILNRFDGIGRTKQLNVYVFTISNRTDNLNSEQILLHETYGFSKDTD